MTVDEAMRLKVQAEKEIARIISDLQESTGMTCNGIEHYVAESISGRVPKVLRAVVHLELK